MQDHKAIEQVVVLVHILAKSCPVFHGEAAGVHQWAVLQECVENPEAIECASVPMGEGKWNGEEGEAEGEGVRW